MSYTLFIRKSAQRALARIAPPFQDHLIKAIRGLSSQPRPAGARKLSGREAWRVRVGDYRIIYEINDAHSAIEIVVIGHRREVYR